MDENLQYKSPCLHVKMSRSCDNVCGRHFHMKCLTCFKTEAPVSLEIVCSDLFDLRII